MGQYVVNGEVIDLREPQPTGALLKEHLGSPANDWVMANTAGGKVVRVGDQQTLPAVAESFDVVPAFTYGS